MKLLDNKTADSPPESRAGINHLSALTGSDIGLQMIREELQLSQKALAEMMGVRQPAIAQMERRGNEIKVATLKRYVEAMGGTLSMNVDLPTGKTMALRV